MKPIVHYFQKMKPMKVHLSKANTNTESCAPHCFLEFKSEEKSCVCGETLPAEIIAFG
jgi:hypothetical protein